MAATNIMHIRVDEETKVQAVQAITTPRFADIGDLLDGLEKDDRSVQGEASTKE